MEGFGHGMCSKERCHSSGEGVTDIQTQEPTWSHPSLAHTRPPLLLGLNLPTAHHVSPAPRSLPKDSSVDAAHPWSCLGTWWHWAMQEHPSVTFPLEPQCQGAVLELGEDGSGIEEKPFFPPEAAEAFRHSQLSPPRCPCPHRTQGWASVPPAGREGQDGRTMFPGLCL